MGDEGLDPGAPASDGSLCMDMPVGAPFLCNETGVDKEGVVKSHQRAGSVAAPLSDASVRQSLARPAFDAQGMTSLATSLMLNGIAMEICGSSRPASGSEHLVSHALDATRARPRLHGLQVGVATYSMCRLQRVAFS
ncbi:hypothetical protein [Humidesulfovibrio sp.]